MLEIILEEEKLDETAKALLNFAGETKVWLLEGEMGVGKTTLIKAICSSLGVKEGMSSPTFGIVNDYFDKNNDIIHHFDLFRIKSVSECSDLGIEEYLSSGNYCFIEWPEIALPFLPPEVVRINIQIKNNIRYLCAEIKKQ